MSSHFSFLWKLKSSARVIVLAAVGWASSSPRENHRMCKAKGTCQTSQGLDAQSHFPSVPLGNRYVCSVSPRGPIVGPKGNCC